jgi:hypothetical protein
MLKCSDKNNYKFCYLCFMGIQEVLLAIIFTLALVYLGRMIYRGLNSDKGCASNCGKCGAADFSKIKIPEQKK